ncbi:ATP-dependent DNA ligase [Streptomyces sp. NPDC058623]|uniref:ATP-dependent DNA ligase n=1 Tax=Streptomyces sp. NPDC058623 TaxID=3346563 RepID=UPI003666025A
MVLRPPVAPMLAQAVEAVPGPFVTGSGLAFEQKFDGFRALLFTPPDRGGRMLLQTRRGSLIQGRFPDLTAAAGPLPDGLVLDGELVVWDRHAGRLSFEGLQRRAATSARNAPALAAVLPAFFIAFDVLQLDGIQVLDHPYWQRRRTLQDLFDHHHLSAPWTLCPTTTDLVTARKWLEDWTDVAGVEGIVVKALDQPYRPGTRGWYKLRRRDTTEAIIGAVTGTLTRPQLLILGRHDPDGRLRTVGRTVPLHPEPARLVGANLIPADPTEHPWERLRFASAWDSRDVLDVTLVRPEMIAEISADTAIDRRGIWRHPVRFKRLRMDLTVKDVPLFGGGPGPNAAVG